MKMPFFYKILFHLVCMEKTGSKEFREQLSMNMTVRKCCTPTHNLLLTHVLVYSVNSFFHTVTAPLPQSQHLTLTGPLPTVMVTMKSFCRKWARQHHYQLIQITFHHRLLLHTWCSHRLFPGIMPLHQRRRRRRVEERTVQLIDVPTSTSSSEEDTPRRPRLPFSPVRGSQEQRVVRSISRQPSPPPTHSRIGHQPPTQDRWLTEEDSASPQQHQAASPRYLQGPTYQELIQHCLLRHIHDLQQASLALGPSQENSARLVAANTALHANPALRDFRTINRWLWLDQGEGRLQPVEIPIWTPTCGAQNM